MTCVAESVIKGAFRMQAHFKQDTIGPELQELVAELHLFDLFAGLIKNENTKEFVKVIKDNIFDGLVKDGLELLLWFDGDKHVKTIKVKK